MPRINLFKKEEITAFDSPPVLTEKERKVIFTLIETGNRKIYFRKKISKVGFLLQLGYFRAHKKFFTPEQYLITDVEYVCKMVGARRIYDLTSENYTSYLKHRTILLDILGYRQFKTFKPIFIEEAGALVRTALRPKDIFHSLLDFLEERRIERPKYYVFAEAISTALNSFESDLVLRTGKLLTDELKDLLDGLMSLPSNPDEINPQNPYLITKLKKPDQRMAVGRIRESLEDFNVIKELHTELKGSIENLAISKELLNYYAVWVIKAEHIQFDSISSKPLKRLYLIAFIIYQFRLRQDLFVDTFLQSVQGYLNKTEKIVSKDFLRGEIVGPKAGGRNFSKLRNIILSSKQRMLQAKEILYSERFEENEKIQRLMEVIPNGGKPFQDQLLDELEKIDSVNVKRLRERMLYSQLSKGYRKIQNKVGGILQALEFNSLTSDNSIIEAIADYKQRNGRVTPKSPVAFVSEKDRKWVLADLENGQMGLYKVFLFKAVSDHIKAGSLNLEYSDKYKSIDEYLIHPKVWSETKNQIIERANLSSIQDFNTFLKSISERLDNQFQNANEKAGDNKNLKIGRNGKPKVITPRTTTDESEGCAEILGKDLYVPLIKILSDVKYATKMSDAFTHYSRKTSKRGISDDILFAALMGLGCNIGVRKMGKISKGIGADKLEYAVRWYFSKENIEEANRRVLSVTESLSLPKIFLRDGDSLHTSSDGQKYGVAIPSIHARYSYKYFGTGKGVSAYSFIDEKSRLFYNTIISTSEREAGYVLDGLMHNLDIESDIHSTDTHGYSEIIFGICNTLGIFFAPRIKNYSNQLLYTFRTNRRKQYEKKGYVLLSSKGKLIDDKLLGSQWDNILRLLCTIKLRESKASEILKRLSSYSKQHPLYRALKELGRIYKTIFLLRYLTETPLRQAITKQLNKVELSHDFANAVFFARNQEFKVATKDEQQIALSCRHLIQNSIILWNYLSISDKLSRVDDKSEYENLLHTVSSSSVITWQHINMLGEYDFALSNKKSSFDMNRIMKFKV